MKLIKLGWSGGEVKLLPHAIHLSVADSVLVTAGVFVKINF